MIVLCIRGEHMGLIVTFLLSFSLITASPASAQNWSPQPWLDDLTQAHQAFATKYANIDWLEHDREMPLASLFDKAASRLRSARSDMEAKTVFDRLIERVGDGHVSIEWPRGAPLALASVTTSAKQFDACEDLGFDPGRSAPGTAASLPGYSAIGAPGPFPAGVVSVGGRTVGVIRIGGFEPQGSPWVCRAALQALHRSASEACDDKCQDAVMTWAYFRLTNALEEQVHVLQAAGAKVLLVDITNNGGGTEWAEAAARILSPKTLTSEGRGFVRGPHWSEQWKALAAQLREAATSAEIGDRSRLLGWAAEAEQAHSDAEQPCIGKECELVGRAGYATGLVGTAHAGEFTGKSWADLVFSIAQFPYHDSVWSGPLAVLVDDQTWSAAEEFAAILQDNGAAAIIGTRTGGAGCGHTNGGTPTTLKNSGATLELPDCVRFRADGSNEVAGVMPDVLTGMKASDGQAFKAKLIEAHLVQIVSMANDRHKR
jgi:hypothetical protein